MITRAARLGRTIAGLRPDRLFLGPAFSVALRVASRRRATYVARGLYALFVAVFVMIAAGVAIGESVEGQARGLGSAARVQTLQAIAPGSAISLAWLQFVAAVLLGPVGAGLMLGDEKRSGALAVVLTTPMSALQLVCARLTAHMVQVALVMSLSIPVLLGLRVFGGLEAGVILRSAALSMSLAAMGASLAMATSLVARRGSVASGVAQAGVVVSMFAMPLGAAFWAHITDGTPASWTLALSAPMQLVMVMGLGAPMPGMPGGDGALLACLGYHGVLTAFGLGLAARRVRASVAGERVGARAVRKDASARRADVPEKVEMPETASARRADVPKAVTARVSREVDDRPVRWREVRVFRVRRGWVVPAVTGGLACSLVWIHGEGDPEAVGFLITLLLGVLTVAFGAVVSGPAVAGEKELRTFDPLMATPMSAEEILGGKLAGVLVRMWPVWALFGLHAVLLVVVSGFAWVTALMVWVCWVPVALVMVMSGLWLSVLCKRGSAASSWNVSVGVAVWAALPMLAAMVGSAATAALGADLSWFGNLVVIHPIARTITAVEGVAGEQSWLLATFRGPMSDDLGIFEFMGLLVVLAGAELGVAWGLWRGAVRTLARRTLRRC